jgi:Pyruvate/2-oxoacid:ferredoxin oxidoreductase gamma subunit
VANVVVMGAFLEETSCLSPETAARAIEDKVKRIELLEVNRRALEAGREFIDKEEMLVGAEPQPDGFPY